MDRRGFLGLLSLLGCNEEDMLTKFLQGIKDALVTNLVAGGDSITVGQAASPASNAYAELLKTNFGATIQNIAASGKGAWHQMNAFKNLTFTRSSTCLSLMVGLNDGRRAGTNAKTTRKIINGYNYFIFKYLSTGAVPAGHATVTRSGFTAFNFQPFGFVYGGGALPGDRGGFTNNNGDYLEWTFTGNNCGVILGGADGVIQTGWDSGAKIYVDGVLRETVNLTNQYDGISDGVYDNAFGPCPIIIWNCGPGTHVMRVEQGTAPCPVDYFSTFRGPEEVGGLLFFDIPYLTAGGYATAPANLTQAISDAYSLEIKNIVDTWRGRDYGNFVHVPTNTYYDTSTGTDADGIHPNNTGHSQIYNGAATEILNHI